MLRKATETSAAIPLNHIMRITRRAGLAMVGAMCGTYVAAELARTNEAFASDWVIALTIVLGTVAFYLGIDIPRQSRCRFSAKREAVDKIDLLSATGTFLTALCALISVYALVFDEYLRSGWAATVGVLWLVGIAMQIGAGLIGRSRPIRPDSLAAVSRRGT
jgi:hypothetical protein